MLISIIGNICTGKTTVARHLSNELGIPYLAVDQYRLRMPERHVYRSLAEDVRKTDDVLVESTGISGRIYDVYRSHGGPRYTILLRCDPQALVDRYNNRTEHVPYPWAKGKSIESEILRMDEILMDKRSDYEIDTGLIPQQQVLDTVLENVRLLLR